MAENGFIQVVVPLRLEWMPAYRCKESVAPGQRVSVMFAHRVYVGVVWKTGAVPGVDASKVQDVLSVVHDLPPVSVHEMRFWEFLSSYYLCTIGEVYKAAYPAGKIRGEQTAAGILERLRARLAVRQESLSRKHKDSVRERLEGECAALEKQLAALTRIPAPDAQKPAPGRPVLLVGGGRSAEYLKACRETVEKGLNAFVLTPEIAAGEQLEAFFEDAFPGQVHRVNSHLTPARRQRIAEDIRSYGGQIVVGTRSALFLPFSRLGLIIIDNEQDRLFKQSDPAPRYNARDAAVMLARIHGARVILGSPSPSLESYHNAGCGKYELRATEQSLPAMMLVDTAAEKRKNGMVGCISRKLAEAAAKADGPIALVRGWEKPDELQADIAAALPGRDVTVLTFQEAMQKGLGGYALVAVLQADVLMTADDFRADERAVQAIAGLREQCRGAFLVQTAKSDHPVFRNYDTIYPRLLEERRRFNLPPFTRLVDTSFGSREERITLPADSTLAARKQEILERARVFEKKTGGRVRAVIDVDPD